MFEIPKCNGLKKHPFLLPHERPICETEYIGNRCGQQLPRFARYQDFIFDQEGQCVLATCYCDKIPIHGGTKSYAPRSVWVLSWVPSHCGNDMHARRICTVLGSHEVCKCGCNGQCSFEAALEVLKWSFGWWKRKIAPDVGLKDARLDPQLQANAGNQLTTAGCLCNFLADGEETHDTLHFKRWNCLNGCCFSCDCTSNNLGLT